MIYDNFEQTMLDLFKLYSMAELKHDEKQLYIIEQQIHSLANSDVICFERFYKEYKDFNRY